MLVGGFGQRIATSATLTPVRPRYPDDLRQHLRIDFGRRRQRGSARGIETLDDEEGHELIIEATTSWDYIGADLRIHLGRLGPEHPIEFFLLPTDRKVFVGRDGSGTEGDGLTEQQNAA